MLNRDFIENIYRDNYNTLYCLIKRWIYPPNPEDIEDILQEVFVIAINNESLESHKNIIGWLIKTAHNKAKQFNEKKSREMKIVLPFTDDLTDNIDIVERIIEKDQLKRMLSQDIINKILKQLNENELMLYRLKYKQKLSYEEICSIMGISLGTARARNSRLVSKIKNIIKECNK